MEEESRAGLGNLGWDTGIRRDEPGKAERILVTPLKGLPPGACLN